MIFSELYSAYYNTVARILTLAVGGQLDDRALASAVAENAFSESVLSVIPALRQQRWQLLDGDSTPLRYAPTMPLTLLEKRWLRALFDDPRLKLFDIAMPELDGVEPLFTREDYEIYDSFADGDPFDDEKYIKRFHFFLDAIHRALPLEVTMLSGHGRTVRLHGTPEGLEYSEKDDKFRVLMSCSDYRYINLSRVTEYSVCREPREVTSPQCSFRSGKRPFRSDEKCTVVLEITNARNALERVMMHFAHFEKRAERLDERHFRVEINYRENDETEMVIRILSFGPMVRVVEPQSFVELIRERLRAQMDCDA